MQVSKINYDICKTCKNGACVNRFAASAKPDRIAALCNRTCLCELEEQGLLENKFERTFRKRAAWSKDIEGKPVDGATESMGRQYLKGAQK